MLKHRLKPKDLLKLLWRDKVGKVSARAKDGAAGGKGKDNAQKNL
jgi:hypothetical protein